jgi:hypothetical protein
MIWTLLFINTSLKLALKLAIFWIFFFQLYHITAQEMIFSHACLLEKESLGFSESNKLK